MSVVIFPQGLQIEQKNLNLEVMNEYSKEWNIERFQLKAGKILQANIKATHTPRMQIGFSTYSDAIAIRGDHPKSTILLSLFSENSFSIYQGTQVGDDELIITKDGDEIDFIANKGSNVISLAVEESFFRQKIEEYFFKKLDTLITNKKIHIHREKSLAFRAFLYHSIVQLQKSSMQQALLIDYTFIENRILEELFSVIRIEEESQKRVKFDITVAKELLHANIEDELSITQIINNLDISKRHFHDLFKDKYGYTPKKYLQILRLNAIQKELIHANAQHICISDIAYKYGYRHMSHFANEYKKMFAELPSTTLQNR